VFIAIEDHFITQLIYDRLMEIMSIINTIIYVIVCFEEEGFCINV